MPLKARSRMISFRLSVEEYDQFRDLCLDQGIRSVSELARAAVNRLIHDPDPLNATNEAIASRVTSLEDQIRTLSLELRRLKQPDNVPNHVPDTLRAAQGA